jgi:hypothetical protein
MPEYLRVLAEIERYGLPGLEEVLRQEGLEAVRYVLWDLTGWHIDYAHALSEKGEATEEHKKRWPDPVFCTSFYESTVIDSSFFVRSASTLFDSHKAPNSAGVRYPRALCGRSWL